MRRRELILGLLLSSVIRRTQAQRTAKVYRIAYLATGSLASNGRYAASFRDALRRLGYVDGQNVVINHQWAEGRLEWIPRLIEETLAWNPDVIVGFGGAQITRALKSATRTVPVVFLTDDAVAEGIIESMARPGGNLTGFSILGGDLDAKRMELIKEALPQAERVAVLHNPERPRGPEQLDTVEHAAQELSLTLEFAGARSTDEVDRALSALAEMKADALLVLTDPMLNAERVRIVDFAVQHRLPGFYFWRDFAEAGGLIAYGADLMDMARRMAAHVGKLLGGTKPGDLPIEQPTRFELVVNLKAARALNLALPLPLLARADEVIE